jgi:hypothetical protein
MKSGGRTPPTRVVTLLSSEVRLRQLTGANGISLDIVLTLFSVDFRLSLATQLRRITPQP